MKYVIKKGFLIDKLDDEIVIFDEEKSVLYTLNHTATEIFKLLKKGLNEEEIIEKMVKKYNVKEDKVKKDFKKLINDLFEKKIIEKI
ncbi:MAG: hypothetical protein Fur009_6150 [Candidatus Microgenomates bacterium]